MLAKETIVKLKKRFNTVMDDEASLLFRALSDPGRLKVVRLLCENDELCVSDLASVFDMSLPAMSQQLKVLELCGLVSRERMGQMICYRLRLEKPLVRSLTRIINQRTS